MSKYKLCLIFLLSFTPGLYANPVCDSVPSAQIVDSLKLQSFKCVEKTTGNCKYHECSGKVPGYSKDVLMLLPETTASLRVHFHGHRNYVYPEYDKDLKSMVKAFDLAPGICAAGEAVLIPESTGSCKDYDKELVDKKSFKKFFDGIHSSTGNHLKAFPLHVSAHSGGGRTIARLLAAGYAPDNITLFDAIFHDEEIVELKKFYGKGRGHLNLFNMASGSPANYTQQLMKNLGLKPRSTNEKFRNKSYTVKKAPRLKLLERQEVTDKGHMTVVTESWNVSIP